MLSCGPMAASLTFTDIILVRMTSDSTRPPEQRYNYKHALDGLVRLVKEEGLKGLTRGLTPNTVRTARFFTSDQKS